ncbi:uncharacterized protein B0I36DRAFT_368602 [Microdochium trichocladiopsis]|uniref:Uncharacterized protein n=1 Tax=Microdochium trichocladiopsis TaxID=1682393 RepID=A0A9P8XUZ8_9PEZI|nr:uncharacterized protein B0I36DRAFT_368602 [Microdochium trichocladiopsis]KAH7018593.1 hypothetical protein B0I36DRAFT_368602 [Microdochium trichocladiopsis]
MAADLTINPADGPKGQTSTQFAVLALSRSSRVRLIDFPEDIFKSIEPVLRSSWPPGIKSEQWNKGAYEYILKEKPWGLFGATAGICAHYLLRDILRFLYEHGWHLATPISANSAPQPCDSLLFRHTPSPSGTPAAQFMAVQISGAAQLTLHGADDEMVDAFQQVLVRMGVLEGAAMPVQESHTFKLRQAAWYNIEEKTMRMRRLIIATAQLMEARGWATYGTIRQRAGSKDVRVPDSWYFIKVPS